MKLLLCGNLHFSVASWSSIYPRMRFNSPHRSAFDSNIEELCQCWPFVNSMWWLTCIQGSIQPVLSQPKLNCSFSGPVNARVPLFYMRCPPNRWRSVQFFIHELTFLLFQFVKKGEKVSHMVLFFFLFFFFFPQTQQWNNEKYHEQEVFMVHRGSNTCLMGLRQRKEADPVLCKGNVLISVCFKMLHSVMLQLNIYVTWACELVRVRSRSCFGLKYLFWSAQTWLEMSQRLLRKYPVVPLTNVEMMWSRIKSI